LAALPKLAVVLISTRNPLNIGAAARAMSNFGFTDLRLVSPYSEAWKEARSAVGAAAVLAKAQVYESLAAAISGCRLVVGTASLGHRDLRLDVRRLEHGARMIRKDAGPVAILFGSEKYGLSNEDLSRCHWLLRIPTSAEHESMNLGQAVALVLYELIRNPRTPQRQYKPRKATAEVLERMEEILGEMLRASGYTQAKTEASSLLKLRRLLRRMNLSARDAEIVLGMLRQIRWKSKVG
jgi:tRNA/rRNA methyltransferase